MRYRNKTYLRIPGGEIQYGHLSHNLTVWWRGRRLTIRGQWWDRLRSRLPMGEHP